MSQEKSIGLKAWETYKKISGLGPILDLAEASIQSASKAIKSNDQNELSSEAIKQEFQARINQSNARTQQEIAIARRIEEADEVEIEEYYDVNGSGNIGFSADSEKLSLGISGDGRKVTKRIYKFRRNSISENKVQSVQE